MPDDTTSSSSAVASRPTRKVSIDALEADEQALANMGKMEMSAPMVNMDDEAAKEAAAKAAAEAEAAAEAAAAAQADADSDDDEQDDTAGDDGQDGSADDEDAQDDEEAVAEPREESEEVEINLHALGQQYQAVVAATAPPPGLTYSMIVNGEQPLNPAMPMIGSPFAPGVPPSPMAAPVAPAPPTSPVDPNYVPTLSNDPYLSMSPQKRMEMIPAQQPVISRYMLSPPTGQSGALSSEIPAARPSTLTPGSLPSQQPGSGVALQPPIPGAVASPGTIAAGFGSVARAAPTGLAPSAAPQAVSFAPTAPAAPVFGIDQPDDDKSPAKKGSFGSNRLEPLSAGSRVPLQGPSPLVIQPPSTELTPSLAAKITPMPLAPFSGELEQTAAPAVPAAQPRHRNVLDILPELRGRKARKIYSSNTKAVWAAQFRIKVMTIVALTAFAVFILAAIVYWMSNGSPTKLEDWPIVKQLVNKPDVEGQPGSQGTIELSPKK